MFSSFTHCRSQERGVDVRLQVYRDVGGAEPQRGRAAGRDRVPGEAEAQDVGEGGKETRRRRQGLLLPQQDAPHQNIQERQRLQVVRQSVRALILPSSSLLLKLVMLCCSCC